MLFTLDKEHVAKNSFGDTRYKAKHQMAQSQRNFPIKKTLRTTSLHLQSSFNPIKQSMHRSKTSSKNVPDIEMAALPPVEIGTRGTVESLIMQEIEYFSRLELGCRDSSKKPHLNVGDVTSSSSPSRPIVGPVVATQKKKKRGSKLLPSICSTVEISENRSVGISGFSYRNLKSDVKKMQV